MKIRVPRALIEEHEELYAELLSITEEGGETGRAAKSAVKQLHPHFIKEEEFAFPILGMLLPLSQGKKLDPKDMKRIISITDQLENKLPKMLQEHKAVRKALRKLTLAAKKELKLEAIRFAKKLEMHAHSEEHVLYPAALLIGKYLKLQQIR